MINPASLLYLPPANFSGANASTVLANLKKYPPKHRMLIYSDDESWKPEIEQEGWVFHKLSQSPEVARKWVKPGPNMSWAVNNLIWLTGLNLAARHGFDHILYLESDCRVGRVGFDDIIFDEHFSIGKPLVCSGSLVVWNPMSGGPVGQRRWAELVSQNVKRNVYIPTYGFKPSTDNTGSSVFPNGAGGVYSMVWMKILFNEALGVGEISGKTLSGMFAWDFWLGEKIWQAFGTDAYDVVAHLNCMFSGYADVLTSESERLAMLKNGKVLVHQVKSDATV